MTAIPAPPRPPATSPQLPGGWRLRAIVALVGFVSLLFSTLGVMVIGSITAWSQLVGLPVIVWGPLDAIAAVALVALCVRWGIQCWRIERELAASGY